MPAEGKNILRYSSGEKPFKPADIFYLHLESLSIKIQPQQNNNPEESDTERNTIHEAYGYSLKLLRSYDKNTHSFYRGIDSIKNLRKDLKEQTMEIINFEEKEMIPLTDYKTKYYKKRKYCHICKEKFCTNENHEKFEKYQKVMDHFHYTGRFSRAAHNICNLRYKVQREILVVSHNGSTYNYHLIIKELAEEFKSDFNCLGENAEKYITFSVPIKK